MPKSKEGNQLSDKEFLKQFENQTLHPDHFKHIDHLRLAWLYISNNDDIETSVELVRSGIKAYAVSLDVGDKFHLTITDSIVRIIVRRIEKLEQKKFQLFLDQNRDLVDDAKSVLLQYFSKDLLFSDTARTSLVQPDIKPI